MIDQKWVTRKNYRNSLVPSNWQNYQIGQNSLCHSFPIGTVAAHKYRVMELLSMTTNAELYRYAVRRQMVTV